jgi:hypothetical protein
VCKVRSESNICACIQYLQMPLSAPITGLNPLKPPTEKLFARIPIDQIKSKRYSTFLWRMAMSLDLLRKFFFYMSLSGLMFNFIIGSWIMVIRAGRGCILSQTIVQLFQLMLSRHGPGDWFITPCSTPTLITMQRVTQRSSKSSLALNCGLYFDRGSNQIRGWNCMRNR